MLGEAASLSQDNRRYKNWKLTRKTASFPQGESIFMLRLHLSGYAQQLQNARFCKGKSDAGIALEKKFQRDRT